MILYFEQRITSWTSRFNIYHESGEVFCTVSGKLSAAGKFVLLDPDGSQIGSAEEKFLSVTTQMSLKKGTDTIATVKKKGFLHSSYEIDNGWTIDGNMEKWDWILRRQDGSEAARLERRQIGINMCYALEIADDTDPLAVILIILAVDAERCSQGSIKKTIRSLKER